MEADASAEPSITFASVGKSSFAKAGDGIPHGVIALGARALPR
jgi:hypothetical protein